MISVTAALEVQISMWIMNALMSLNVLIEQHHVATMEIAMQLLMPVIVMKILKELIAPYKAGLYKVSIYRVLHIFWSAYIEM